MAILITNIKELVNIEESPKPLVAGKEMSNLKTLKNAWLLIEGDRIKASGREYQIRDTRYTMREIKRLIPDRISRISDRNMI